MNLKLHHVGWLAVWLVAAFGVLQIERIPGEYGHALCGVWGCYPPLQALLAMHLFWTVLLIPLLVWILCSWSPRGRWWAAMLFLTTGLVGIGMVLFQKTVVWALSVPPEFRQYLLQRFIFSLLTLSDWPLLQLTIVGLICRLSVSRRRKRMDQSSPGAVVTVASNGCSLSNEPGSTELGKK
jgi:hypothetical protein